MAELTPYLCVADAHAAVEWYVDEPGAAVALDPIVMDTAGSGTSAGRR